MKTFITYIIVLLFSVNGYTQCHVRTLANDLDANPSLQTALDALPVFERKLFVKGHKIFRTRPEIRLDIPSCKKMGELVSDLDFMAKLPGGESRLFEIASVLVNKCSSCPLGPTIMKPMVDYLDDLKYFVINYSDKPGFSQVILALKNSNFHVQDGTAHLLAIIKAYPQGNLNIAEFEGNILQTLNDADGVDIVVNWDNLCTGCMFDLKLSDGTRIEAKSYRLSTVQSMSSKSQFNQQFEAYMGTLPFKPFIYWFNPLKEVSLINLKDGFKQIFSQDDYFDSIGGANNPFMQSLGIANETVFLQRVDLPGSNLYDFIKGVQ